MEKKYYFRSEIKQLLHLMIHSLYTNKEIFLRELLSNSLDAIDKVKYFLLTHNENIYKVDNNKIIIKLNHLDKTITIIDNGIGMLEQEIIDGLGTIANSNTKKFLEQVDINKDYSNVNIIGQFGVGFYSSFMVTDKVVVHTKSIKEQDSNAGILWTSQGIGQYTISNLYKKDYGTDVILYINEQNKSFLDFVLIKQIIQKYFSHISIPIYINYYNNNTKTHSTEHINNENNLWVKEKSSITDEEYINFYKKLTNNLGNPLIWSHSKIEGKINYHSLLFIPDVSPWDIWNRDEYKNSIKLYVRRVFVMDDFKKIIPMYLRFIQGIVDTNDLPLNISRELLQDDVMLSTLKLLLTKKILKLLQELSIDIKKYIIFWIQFGNILKEGLAEDIDNKQQISSLLRFYSSSLKTDKEYISLDDYLTRMKAGQDKIYYLTSETYVTAINSPHLEMYNNRNIEVLLLCDRIDEWMMTYLTDYKNIQFTLISKDYELNKNMIDVSSKKIIDVDEKHFVNLIVRIKKILGSLVKDVRITNRLENSPVILVTDTNEMSTQMLKLLTAAGKKAPQIKYFFEINIRHLLIKYINSIIDERLFKQWVFYIYYQALLVESNTLDNPAEFINIANNLLLSIIIK